MPILKNPKPQSDLKASDVLGLSDAILHCAILDDAGRILSYAESENGRKAMLPKDSAVTIRALAIQGLSESLDSGLGSVKFTTVVTDRYRLVTVGLAGRIAMFALPHEVLAEKICEEAIKKWGSSSLSPR